ncbi:signal peptide peptidase SppA [bacterium]|nr:MAG: signal peptide peptidase SppA [bacterium]
MSDTPDEHKPQDLAGAPAEPAPNPEPAPEPRRPRRLAVKALIGLYAASLLAAGVLLLRPTAKEGPKEKASIKLPKGLLSSGKKEYVGVVQIEGAIFQQDGGGVWAKGSGAWGKRLERLAKKTEVKAIVLAINSPGGSVGSVQELHALLARIRKEHKKPVVAQLGDVAASGGYYLAVACDKIVAHPGTLVGSIGVIFNTMNVEGLMAKLGVKQAPIKSGKMKDIGSMTRPMTEEERALLQGVIDNAYGQFLVAVADGRHMTVDAVKPFADGRIVTGEQALKLGYVDELGDSWRAVQLAAELGGIQGTPEVYREGEALSGIMDMLESRLAFMRGPDLGLLERLGALQPAGLEYRWRP